MFDNWNFFLLQVEKDELQSALEEAESALEQEENRVLRAQMEVVQARQVKRFRVTSFQNLWLQLKTSKVKNITFDFDAKTKLT